MAWITLKEAIANAVKTNGNQEITGAVLQNTLNSIVNAVGENATFAGVATPTTNPGLYDGPVFYIASIPGVYVNFNGLTVEQDTLVAFVYTDNYWAKLHIFEASKLVDGSITSEKIAPGAITPNTLSQSTIDLINVSGGSITNLPDDEDLISKKISNNLSVLKFKDRNPSESKGYVILRKNKSIKEQITEANTIYEVRYSFDLNNSTLIMPDNCTLKFEGGSINNGTIELNYTEINTIAKPVFNNIYLQGRHSKINSSFLAGKTFSKLNYLRTLSCDILEIDEDLTVTSPNYARSFNAKKLLFTKKIILGLDITNLLKDNYEIEGLCFDGNGHACTSVISCNNSDSVLLKNISIYNINCNEGQFCQGITINNTAKKISISGIKINNISTVGNGIIGDSIGNISGIYVCPNCDNAIVEISDCIFKNLINYDNNGNEILEDISCIYISRLNKDSNFSYISNIKGYNFGKRLIKTDAGNMIINDVYAESYNENKCLAVIGLNNGDGRSEYANVIINNIIFKGHTSYIVASSVHDVIINNISADFSEKSILSPSCVIYVNSRNVTADNIYCKNGILGFTKAGCNLTLNKCVCEYDIPSTRIYKGHLLFESGCNIFLNECTFNMFEHIYLSPNYALNKQSSINFSKCHFNFNATSDSNNYFAASGIALGYLKYSFVDCVFNINSAIRTIVGNCYNLVFKNNHIHWHKEHSSSVFCCIVTVNNKSVIEIENNTVFRYNPVSTLHSYYINAHESLDINTQKEIIFRDITSGSASVAKNIFWKNIVNIKVFRDYSFTFDYDAFGCGHIKASGEYVIWNGSKWVNLNNVITENKYGKGTTEQRPTNLSHADINFQYFDTTIGKPIWWKGAVWVDANGANV